MAMLPLKASHKKNSVLLFIFCGQKDFAQMLFTEIRPVYGGKCFTRPPIHVWCKKFACGWESVVDEKKPGWCVFQRLMQRSQQSRLSYGLTGVRQVLKKFGRYAEK